MLYIIKQLKLGFTYFLKNDFAEQFNAADFISSIDTDNNETLTVQEMGKLIIELNTTNHELYEQKITKMQELLREANASGHIETEKAIKALNEKQDSEIQKVAVQKKQAATTIVEQTSGDIDSEESRYRLNHNTPSEIDSQLEKQIDKISDEVGAREFLKTIDVKNVNRNDKELVKKIQKALVILGYDLGKYGPNKDGVDGAFGRGTRRALKQEKAKQEVEKQKAKVEKAKDLISSLNISELEEVMKMKPKEREEKGYNEETIKKIQQALVDSGYKLKGKNNGVDGILGKGTLDALKIEKNSLSASIRRFKKNNFFTDFEEIYGMGAISTIDPDQSLQKKITKLKENGLKNPEKSKTEINALYKEFLEKIIYITDLDDNDEVKVLNKVKDYQENGNIYDKIVVLSEFNNASMHSELTGEDGNKINERSSMEKEEKGRLGLFNEGLKTIGINQGDYIRNIFYKNNKNVDKSSSTYHENAVGLTVRDYKGDKGAVNIDAQVPVELVDAKIVNLRKTTKRIKSILSHDINYKHFAEMFIKETGVTPRLNQMVKAIRVGHITLGGKYYKIDSKVFFSKAANCFNDFVGIEMDITPAKKPRKRVHRGPGKRVKHVDTPVVPVEPECTALQFMNGECGPSYPPQGGGGEGGNGGFDSSGIGVSGGGSNGGGGSGGGNTSGR